MTRAELFRVKVGLVQVFLQENGYDGILLSQYENFAMATGGARNHIYTMSEHGVCSLFIDKEGRVFLVANTIELPRIMDEELVGLEVEPLPYLWFESTPATVVQLHFNGHYCSDDGSLGDNVNGKLAYIRSLLTPVELEKYRRLGKLAAEAMTATLDAIEPGMTEADVAARIVAEGAKRKCVVPVALVAADERIAKYRHPLPTEAPLVAGFLEERRIQGYVMVVGCYYREGLVASITRFKRVGALPEGVEEAFPRIAAVDALMQEATQPGRTLGDVFAACQQGYVAQGFPENEWHNHHQGGATGYAGRTMKGTPGQAFPVGDTGYARKVTAITGIDVAFGQAYAWNPSAKGVKSEDTFILLPDGSREIVTRTPSLPCVDLEKALGRVTEVVKSGMA
ncbi:MAG: M24 family metallopeptidase [FCB group bacterium]|jgi:antitoxin VapB|nr:M24 family metallopeptidase [FCB group bacterium]